MSLKASFRISIIWKEFKLIPTDGDFWCVWEQLLAIEQGWA